MSVRARALRLLQQLWERVNEAWLNIDTVARVEGDDPTRPAWRGPHTTTAAHDDNNVYASPDYWYLRRIFRALQLRASDVVYDVGAGMGRIVCLAAQYPIAKAVGVELFEDLCLAARANVRRRTLSLAAVWGRGQAPIEIRQADAAVDPMADGTVYCLFNSFGADTLADMLRNLERSFEARPRRMRLVYYNAVHEDLVAAWDWERTSTFRTRSGLRVSVWEYQRRRICAACGHYQREHVVLADGLVLICPTAVYRSRGRDAA